jgi:hypothetical protein
METILICVIVVMAVVLVKMFIDSRNQSKELKAIIERLRKSEGALSSAVNENTPKGSSTLF